MNRFARRRQKSIDRKIDSLPPAARELAISTGMEMFDASAQKEWERMKARANAFVDQRFDEIYKAAYEDAQKYVWEHMPTDLRKQSETADKEARRWRRAYLGIYVDAIHKGVELTTMPDYKMTADEALLSARLDFHEAITILDNRVTKEAKRFEHGEELYLAMLWLASTYRDAKLGIERCADLDASCRGHCGFSYAPHQSEVTMGFYKSDYEVKYRGETVLLREHLAYGGNRDARHTIRIAFFFDTVEKQVVIGYIGQHQQTRLS
jgi:hypothetical protein